MTKIPRKASNPTRKDFLRGAAATALLPLLPSISRGAAERIGFVEITTGIFVHTGQYALVNSDNVGDISNACCTVGSSAVAVIDTSGTYALGKGLHAQSPRSPTSRSAMSSTPTCTPTMCLETLLSRARAPNLSAIINCLRLSPPAPKATCATPVIVWERRHSPARRSFCRRELSRTFSNSISEGAY